MNLALYRHLLRRTLRGKRLIGAGALAAVAGIAAWVSMAGIDTPATADIYRTITASVPPATLAIALLIISSATLRDERDGGTLPYVYLSPVPARVFAVSATAAALSAALLVAGLGWVIGWIGAGVMTGSWTLALPALALYGIATVGYTAVFVPLGYLLDRSLIIGLAYIFVWEGILASAVSGLGSSSVWRIAMSAYADLDELPRDALDVLGSVTPGKWGATATILVLLVLGTAVLTWAVRRRDAV
jgi:hypothetical protein